MRAVFKSFAILVLSACGPATPDIPSIDAPVGGGPDGSVTTAPDATPQVCSPGQASCTGTTLTVCNFDGSGWTTTDCVAPEECSVAARACVDPCLNAALEQSYIGCDYLAAITPNAVWQGTFHFAIAAANESPDQPANVTVTGGGLPSPITFTVAPASVGVQILPWISSLSNTWGNATLADGAYRVVSSRPVVLYQFSPLEYVIGSEFSYTNDASILFPTTALGTSYRVASYYNSGPGGVPSMFSITAAEDGTSITVTPTADVVAGNGVPAMPIGVPTTFTMNRGDIMQVATLNGDVTGSLVESDKPIQVIGLHPCTFVPLAYSACDHLEESIFPITALGTRYLVVAPAIPPAHVAKVEVVRIVATEPATTITYDPPIAGAPTTIAQAGQWIELEMIDYDFEIDADKKVLVSQYMTGQSAGGDTGDPAMTVAVPVEQYRDEYLFHTPLTYEIQYVNVTAPIGSTVTVDGDLVTLFPIGGSGWGFARVPLDGGPANDGNHLATGTDRFGIAVYGYGQYTSYWYPGGMNLMDVPIE